MTRTDPYGPHDPATQMLRVISPTKAPSLRLTHIRGRWYWKLYAGNGRPLTPLSNGFSSCRRAIDNIVATRAALDRIISQYERRAQERLQQLQDA